MEYCVAATKKGLEGSGIEKGQKLLVIATKVLPEKKSDPYLQRVYVVCIKVNNGFHEMPNSGTGDLDNGYRSYLMDPRSLTRLDDKEQERLRDMLSEQYEGK